MQRSKYIERLEYHQRQCPWLYILFGLHILGATTRHFGYQQENGTLSLGRQQVHFVQEESTMEKTCDLVTARIGIVLRTIMRFYPVSARVNQVLNDDEECSTPVEPVQTQNQLLF